MFNVGIFHHTRIKIHIILAKQLSNFVIDLLHFTTFIYPDHSKLVIFIFVSIRWFCFLVTLGYPRYIYFLLSTKLISSKADLNKSSVNTFFPSYLQYATETGKYSFIIFWKLDLKYRRKYCCLQNSSNKLFEKFLLGINSIRFFDIVSRLNSVRESCFVISIYKLHQV